MTSLARFLLAGLILPLLHGCATHEASLSTPAVPIRWEPWSDAAFARAKAEHKLVLLDLQAVWCHWCHVMEETTYADAEVAQLLSESFVTIQVDQDARPDISIRYEDWGWPATILFDSEGREIVKRSGFIQPGDMKRLLRAVIADPTPGPSVEPVREIVYASSSALDEGLEKELSRDVFARYDSKEGGYGRSHKYVDALSVEWLMSAPKAVGANSIGDDRAERMARQTLDAGLALFDPVWGGVYQYSTDGVWDHAHFEKIMSFQADEMRLYALAAAKYDEPKYAQAAHSVRRFLKTFLTSPDGAFYTSQDADLVQGEHSGEYFALDDAGRRALGVPRVDKHVYSRENGWAIAGLCALSSYTGDAQALDDARKAAEWIVRNRSLAGGGFRHDERDAAGPYLGDTLAMGQAFLALYEATAERAWLQRAADAARFVARTFAAPSGKAGFRTAAPTASPLDVAVFQREENIACARFANALMRYAGGTDLEAMRDEALRFLATPEIAMDGLPGGVLLAAHESRTEPLHVTIVGKKSDAAAKALFMAARALPVAWKRVEWLDPAEGPLPNDDVPFPDSIERAAAFVCVDGRCLSPAYETQEVAQRVASSRRAR